MSGETEKNVSGWTVDTLKAYFDEMLSQETKRLDDRFEREHLFLISLAEERQMAQDKFEEGVTARFAQVNEFRGSLDDLGKQMATRRELEGVVKTMSERADQNASQIGELRSRLDVGPAGLAPLQAYQQQQTGRQEGVSSTNEMAMRIIQILIAGIALVITVYFATHGG